MWRVCPLLSSKQKLPKGDHAFGFEQFVSGLIEQGLNYFFLHHSPADPVAPLKSKYLHVCKCSLFFFCMHSFLFYPHERWTLYFICLVHAVPLYQDYCQRTVEDLPNDGLVPEPKTSQSFDLHGEGLVPEPKTSQRLEDLTGGGLVPEPITSQSILALQGILFRAKFQVSVPPPQVSVPPPQVSVPPPQVSVPPPQVTIPPLPPAHFPRDHLTTFWQDLDEVKECGVLATLSPREVHRQEVGVCLSVCLSLSLCLSV